MAHFICSPAELAQARQAIILGCDLQSCPLLFDSLTPQIVYKTHTDNRMPQNKLFPDSAKLIILSDENVTAFADKPSDTPKVMSPAPCPHSHLRMVNT